MGIVDEYESAEARLFARYGLQPRARYLELTDPRLRARVLEIGGDPASHDHGRTPVLFLAGGMQPAAEGAALFARMPTSTQLVAVDRPGCGLTDGFDYRGVDLHRHASSFLLSVIDELGFDKVDLVGNSMGGLWCLFAALDRPDRIRSVTLVGWPAFVLGMRMPLPLRLFSVRGLNRLLLRLQPSGRSGIRRMLSVLGESPAADGLPDEYFAWAALTSRLPHFATAWCSAFESYMSVRGARRGIGLQLTDLARITIPVLMLLGDRDPFGDVMMGRQACEALPDARMKTIRAGHLPWLDDAGACADEINAFLVDSLDEPRDRNEPSDTKPTHPS